MFLSVRDALCAEMVRPPIEGQSQASTVDGESPVGGEVKGLDADFP